MFPRKLKTARHRYRRSFTLTELLVVVMIISLLASTVMFAMYGAVEMAREARTRTQIVRLNELLMTRWESYRTRAIRLRHTPRHPRAAARVRLHALRDLMRMEMPDRITDVRVGPVSGLAQPSLQREYQRRVANLVSPPDFENGMDEWSEDYQGAECLYMIIASIRTLDGNGLDFLREEEIGDVDGDDMPEILDAWGNPIDFIRWPAGFASESDIMSDDPATSPDPFDPLRVTITDRLENDPDREHPDGFALYPLIYSAGPDQQHGIFRHWYDEESDEHFRYSTTDPPNDPYVVIEGGDADPMMFGEPHPVDQGVYVHYDNIHNHALGVR